VNGGGSWARREEAELSLADGSPIVYRIEGPRLVDALPLVLSHGLTTDTQFWDRGGGGPLPLPSGGLNASSLPYLEACSARAAARYFLSVP